jgi:superfamily II DNA/RNA helicase
VLRQTLFFSATMPPEIRRLADKFLSNPKEISVDKPATASVLVEQRLVRVPQDDKAKRDVLRQLLQDEDKEIASALIFCNRKRDVATLHRSLEKYGFDAKALHGDMSQPARTETLEQFRQGKFRLLVCSDVAARGLDIPAVSHVFNFDVPIHAEDYVHRIGRTGRAGRSGKSFTLAQPDDGKFLAAIRRLTGGKEIPAMDGEGEAVAEAPVAVNGHAERPARAGSERKGRGRGRGGRRSEKPRTERRPQAAEPQAERPMEQPAERQAERPPERPTERHADRPIERRQDRRERAPERGRGAERDRRPSDRPHHPTESFGDHTPAFLLKA